MWKHPLRGCHRPPHSIEQAQVGPTTLSPAYQDET